MKIKKESKGSLFGGRFLNVTVQKVKRGGYRRERKERMTAEESMKAKSNVLPKKSGTE